jgi:hypothetical protein
MLSFPCHGPALPLPYHDHLVSVHPCGCKRPPTSVPQRRELRCRAHQCLRLPSIPVTSRTPNGRSSRRCCRRQRGGAGPAPGRCDDSSTRSSTSCAPAVPGAIFHGSIRRGKRPIQHSASGACTGSGSVSTRRYAARSACGLGVIPSPQRRSWIAKVGLLPPVSEALL